MKKIFLGVFITFFVLGCNKTNNDFKATEKVTQELLSRKELNEFIHATLIKKNEFWWKDANLNQLWSAGQQSDKIYSIGYKPSQLTTDEVDVNIHNIDINEASFKNAKTEILNIIQVSEKNYDLEKLISFTEDNLPFINVKINDIKTLELLRKSNLIRYIEPMGYEVMTTAEFKNQNNNNITLDSDNGCGTYAPLSAISNDDYVNFGTNNKQSWNHSFHNILPTWNKNIKGTARKIMVIDTGISPDQNNYNDGVFNSGLSTGRTIQRIVTLREWRLFGQGPLETVWDDCGHGTSMAGACAAPAAGDGNAVGIAYGASLVTCNGTDDVYLNESREINGVSNALTWAGNNDVNIVSMSLGRILSSSQLRDAVRYVTNRNKLVFCAGGTSFGWTAGWVGVIFPGTMPEVSAVTGVKNSVSLTTRCDVCHDGNAIDFTVVMEKSTGNAKHALTTAMYGDMPGDVGGSSVATASAAGMAALVWSKNTSWSASTVLNKLITTSSNYPNKSSNLGWGRINANAATN